MNIKITRRQDTIGVFPDTAVPAMLELGIIRRTDHFWHDGMSEPLLVETKWPLPPDVSEAPKAATPIPTITPVDSGPASTEPAILEKRSGWAWSLRFLAILSLLVGLAGCAIVINDGRMDGQSMIVAIVGFVSFVQLLLAAFLIDVFTDIRWYLAKMHKTTEGPKIAPQPTPPSTTQRTFEGDSK